LQEESEEQAPQQGLALKSNDLKGPSKESKNDEKELRL